MKKDSFGYPAILDARKRRRRKRRSGGGFSWTSQNATMKLDARSGNQLTDSIGSATGTILTPVFLQAAASSAYIGGNKGETVELCLDGNSYTYHCKIKHVNDVPTGSSEAILILGGGAVASRRGIYIYSHYNRFRLMANDGANQDTGYMTDGVGSLNSTLSGAGILDLYITVDYTNREIKGSMYNSSGNLVGIEATLDITGWTFNTNDNFSSIRFSSKSIAIENFKKFSGIKTLEQCQTDNYATDIQIHLPSIIGAVDNSGNALDFTEISMTTDDISYVDIDTWVHDYGYDTYHDGDPAAGGYLRTVYRDVNSQALTINRGAGTPTIGYKVIAQNDGRGNCNLKDAKIRFSDSFFDRSNATIWGADARSASDYDASDTNVFHLDNLNQRTLMSWLNNGYKGRLYVKWSDNSIEKFDRKYLKEIILTTNDIKGDTQINAFRNTGDVFAAVQSGGSYTYDVNGYAQLGYLKSTRPMITFRFDDAVDSQYDDWYPFLQDQGIGGKATTAIHSNLVGDSGYMTWVELATLRAAGWDISSHNPNDSNFTGSSPSTAAILDQIETLLNESITDAAAQNISCEFYVGNRYSMENPSTGYFAHKVGFKGAISWGGCDWDGVTPQGANPAAIDLFNMYAVNSDILVAGTPAADLFYLDQSPNTTQIQNTKDEIDDAVANNKWIIFMLHSHGSTVDTAMDEIIDYAQTVDIDFVNLTDGLDNLTYQV